MGGDDLFEGPFRGGLLDGGAGDGEEPVVAVVEVEKHLPAGMEDRRNPRPFHAPVARFSLSYVGEQGVAFLAAVGVLEVVAEFEGVVEVETDGLDDERGEGVERTIAADGNLGGEAAVLDGEVVFLHG